jgi:hypothetical protein
MCKILRTWQQWRMQGAVSKGDFFGSPRAYDLFKFGCAKEEVIATDM